MDMENVIDAKHPIIHVDVVLWERETPINSYQSWLKGGCYLGVLSRKSVSLNAIHKSMKQSE